MDFNVTINGLLSEDCSENIFFCTVCYAVHDHKGNQRMLHRYSVQELNLRVQNILASQDLNRMKLKWNDELNVVKKKREELLLRDIASQEPPEIDSNCLYEALSISASNSGDVNFIYCELYLCKENLGLCSLFPGLMKQPFSILLFSDMCSILNVFMGWMFEENVMLPEDGWKQGALFSRLTNVIIVKDFLRYLENQDVNNLRMIAIAVHLKTAVQIGFYFYHSSANMKRGLQNTYNMLYSLQCELHSTLRESRG